MAKIEDSKSYGNLSRRKMCNWGFDGSICEAGGCEDRNLKITKQLPGGEGSARAEYGECVFIIVATALVKSILNTSVGYWR